MPLANCEPIVVTPPCTLAAGTSTALRAVSLATKYVLPIPPSPNLRSEFAISLYPSLCLFEGTTVSVGRGTDTPFEVFGHPMWNEFGAVKYCLH